MIFDMLMYYLCVRTYVSVCINIYIHDYDKDDDYHDDDDDLLINLSRKHSKEK